MDYGLMVVLQSTKRTGVGARPQVVGSLAPKMLTHVGDLIHKGEEALKIRPVRERSEPYLEGPARSGIVDVRETNTPVKQKLYLILQCKPQTVAPQGALRQSQKTSSSQRLT